MGLASYAHASTQHGEAAQRAAPKKPGPQGKNLGIWVQRRPCLAIRPQVTHCPQNSFPPCTVGLVAFNRPPPLTFHEPTDGLVYQPGVASWMNLGLNPASAHLRPGDSGKVGVSKLLFLHP